MATHSSTLAWKIPWTEESDRPQSIGSWRVRHDWETSLSLFTFMHWRRRWQPTPIPGTEEPSCGVAHSQTQLKQLSSSSNRDHLTYWRGCAQVMCKYYVILYVVLEHCQTWYPQRSWNCMYIQPCRLCIYVQICLMYIQE